MSFGTFSRNAFAFLFLLPSLSLVSAQTSVIGAQNLKRVTVDSVSLVDSVRTPSFSGRLRSASRADLAFTVSGRLAERRVQLGDRVEQGETLAVLDQAPFKHALAAARAEHENLTSRYQQAQREFKRVEALHAANAATQEELDALNARQASLKAALAAAETQLEEAQRLLKETVLSAPYSGTVSMVAMEPGEFAAPGRTVVSLAGSGSVELEVEVPETVAVHLTTGSDVRVRFPLMGKEVGGRLRSVGNAARGRGLFPVLVDLSGDTTLRAGMTAELLLEVHEDQSLSVPIAAVLNPGGAEPLVYKIADNSAQRVIVKVGRLQGERVTVDADLEEGDLVVIGGHAGLIDGDQVEVVK